jgi:hypothetical protein
MLRRQSRNRSGDPSTPLKEPRLSKRNQAEKSRVRKRRAAKDISLPLLPSICRTVMPIAEAPLRGLGTETGEAWPEFVWIPIGY